VTLQNPEHKCQLNSANTQSFGMDSIKFSQLSFYYYIITLFDLMA